MSVCLWFYKKVTLLLDFRMNFSGFKATVWCNICLDPIFEGYWDPFLGSQLFHFIVGGSNSQNISRLPLCHTYMASIEVRPTITAMGIVINHPFIRLHSSFENAFQ